MLIHSTAVLLIALFGVKAQGVTEPNILVGVAIIYGGVCQFIAGIMEFVAGNTVSPVPLSC